MKIKRLLQASLALLVYLGLICGCATALEAQSEVPSAPSHLVLTGTSAGFQLTWSLSAEDPGAVTGYEIVRASFISGPYEEVGTVGGGVNQFLDTKVPKENIVYYKVRALAKGNASPFSQVIAGEFTGK